MKKGHIILLLFALLFACGDIENCGADQNSEIMFISFFDLKTRNAKTVGFEVFSSDPSVQFLLPAVTKVENGDTTVVRQAQTLGLPLNPNTNSITYSFISDSSSHELVLSYEKEFSIYDPNCEPSLLFTNLDTVSQTFDSTVIVSRVTQLLADPNNTSQQISNIEIYF